MGDLSKYKMTDMGWLKENIDKYGWDELNRILTKIQNIILRIPKGRYYDIEKNVPEEWQELFVKHTCWFLSCHYGWDINPEYTRIRKF